MDQAFTREDTAHAWYDAMQAAADAQPGDLVFAEFGEDSPGLPGHVGIYEGNGRVLDAPHSGAFVRYEAVAPWGYVTYARVSVGN